MVGETGRGLPHRRLRPDCQDGSRGFGQASHALGMFQATLPEAFVH